MVITFAGNGKEAVDIIERHPSDIVMMDIQIPLLDGYEATKIIRKKAQFKSLPIIAMTAHAMKGDEQKCLDAGMDDYISKPINRKKLFDIIKHYLG